MEHLDQKLKKYIEEIFLKGDILDARQRVNIDEVRSCLLSVLDVQYEGSPKEVADLFSGLIPVGVIDLETVVTYFPKVISLIEKTKDTQIDSEDLEFIIGYWNRIAKWLGRNGQAETVFAELIKGECFYTEQYVAQEIKDGYFSSSNLPKLLHDCIIGILNDAPEEFLQMHVINYKDRILSGKGVSLPHINQVFQIAGELCQELSPELIDAASSGNMRVKGAKEVRALGLIAAAVDILPPYAAQFLPCFRGKVKYPLKTISCQEEKVYPHDDYGLIIGL